MPYISELEPSEAAGAKSSRLMAWDVSKGITPGFNLALFAYSTLWGLLQFLFLSGKAQNATFEGLILSSAVDLVRFTAAVLISAGFLQAFWRRLVTSLAPVRALDFQEASRSSC
jgi:hypothetical protein